MGDGRTSEFLCLTYISQMKDYSHVVFNFPPLSTIMSSITTFVQCYVLKPETLAICLLLLGLYFFFQSVQLWYKSVINRLQYSTSLAEGFGVFTAPSGKHDFRTWELREGNANVYALQGRRPQMEDRFSLMIDRKNDIALYGVFDGHGGEFAAKYAEQHLFKNLLPKLQDILNQPEWHKPEQAKDREEDTPEGVSENLDPIPSNSKVDELTRLLTEEILTLDKELIVEAKSSGDVAGTTAVVALVHNQQLIVANVGDSRGVLCGSEEVTIPATFDHKPQQLKEHKRIKEAGGFITFNGVWRVAGILATSRALGDYPLKDRKLITAEPDILTFNLKEITPQFMILATDGLWDAFTNEEAVLFISNHLDEPYLGAKSLVMQAYLRGSVDNVTVMVVDFRDFSPKDEVFI
ncbi:protein phosphatase 1L-like [Limulus polyphemus]|uniref:Protein phosphatase 1L-like n=1 Tax=Limulus polyphemus TaxID=6850 RepID=A0ABM1B5P3_LIMPO|nr:protein phosphatase 1L-like [Limulus polyphemus]